MYPFPFSRPLFSGTAISYHFMFSSLSLVLLPRGWIDWLIYRSILSYKLGKFTFCTPNSTRSLSFMSIYILPGGRGVLPYMNWRDVPPLRGELPLMIWKFQNALKPSFLMLLYGHTRLVSKMGSTSPRSWAVMINFVSKSGKIRGSTKRVKWTKNRTQWYPLTPKCDFWLLASK